MRDEKKKEADLFGDPPLILADPGRAGGRLLRAYLATT
jgi:hypothetical protein